MPESRGGLTVVTGVLGYCTVRKHVELILFNTVSVHTVQVCSVKCPVNGVHCVHCEL